MDLQNKTETIEKELLELVIQHLQKNEIAVEKAEQLAKDFLAVLPVQSHADLLAKLKSLGDRYEEAKLVYNQEFSQDLQQKETAALDQMRNAIQQGNIEHAIAVAKDLHTQ